MPQYRIIKQGYMLKEPPYSKRGMRKVRNICSYARVSMRRDRRAANAVLEKGSSCMLFRARCRGFRL